MGLFGLFKPNIKRMEKRNDINGLTKALRHEDSEIRLLAATALGRIGVPSDLATQAWYWAALKEWDKLQTLGADGLERLISALKSVGDTERRAVSNVLIAIGPGAVKGLIMAVRGATREQRELIKDVIVGMGESAVKPLEPFFNERRLEECLGGQSMGRFVGRILQEIGHAFPCYDCGKPILSHNGLCHKDHTNQLVETLVCFDCFQKSLSQGFSLMATGRK